MQKTTTSSAKNSDGTQPPIKELTPAEAKARLKASKIRFDAVLKGVNYPLAIGIHTQLREALPGIPSKHFQHFMYQLAKSRSYLQATIDAPCRYDLQNGESELLDKDRQLAKKKLDAFKKKPKRKQQTKPRDKPDTQPKVTAKRRRTLTLKGAR